jgi:hypothetical protein
MRREEKETRGLAPVFGKKTMMYKAVRTYTLLPGSSEEFLQRVQEGFVPLMSQQVGFISYDARSLGNDQVITISTFDTRNGAEESMLRALLWIQENCTELLQGLPLLTMSQVFTAQTSSDALHADHGHVGKTLVLDLSYEILHPSALGAQAYTDPDITRMVTAIGTVLTQMKTDPVGRDRVYVRFEHEILPEVVTTGLYTADHVILIKRGDQLAGYAEINRETNAWQSRERFEGDIIVDLAAYHRNAGGDIAEKGIGEQSLLEMRRQAMLLGVTAIELDVYRGNQPMHRFLDHLIATHRLPFTKHEMEYGEPMDSTYLLSCEPASVERPTSSVSGSANR